MFMWPFRSMNSGDTTCASTAGSWTIWSYVGRSLTPSDDTCRASASRGTGSNVEPDGVANPAPVPIERPSSFVDEARVRADADQAPQHVREGAGSHPWWQIALLLEPARAVEQFAVAIVLARPQRLLDLRMLPTGRREGLVDPPHLGDDLDIHGDHRVERIQGGHLRGDRMPLDDREDIGGEDVEMEVGQQLGLGREVEVDRLPRDPGLL